MMGPLDKNYHLVPSTLGSHLRPGHRAPQWSLGKFYYCRSPIFLGKYSCSSCFDRCRWYFQAVHNLFCFDCILSLPEKLSAKYAIRLAGFEVFANVESKNYLFQVFIGYRCCCWILQKFCDHLKQGPYRSWCSSQKYKKPYRLSASRFSFLANIWNATYAGFFTKFKQSVLKSIISSLFHLKPCLRLSQTLKLKWKW